MSGLAGFTESFLQALTAGLLVGCIYGLMCLGLGLIFGVMRVINFAQGDFLMLGMYFTLYLAAGLAGTAVFGPVATPFIAAICAGPVLFVGGFFCTGCSSPASREHASRGSRAKDTTPSSS